MNCAGSTLGKRAQYIILLGVAAAVVCGCQGPATSTNRDATSDATATDSDATNATDATDATATDSDAAAPCRPADAGTTAQDAAVDGQADAASKAARCASAFGDALTAPFGRLDGTVVAIVKPTDQQCAQPNSTHLTLQVAAHGKVYRMVVNVLSTRAGSDPDVRFGILAHALPAPAWSEGWHGAATLDYVTTLGAHTAAFLPVPMADLVSRLDAMIALDSEVSVYASTSGGDSAHLVHRNLPNQDGTIVLGASTCTPTFLLFHFDNQTF